MPVRPTPEQPSGALLGEGDAPLLEQAAMTKIRTVSEGSRRASPSRLPGRRHLDDHVRRLDDADRLVADLEAHLLDGLGGHEADQAMGSGDDLDHGRDADPLRPA